MRVKKIVFIMVVIIFILIIGTGQSNASLYLNSLDFTANINSDGTMDVIEKWDIDISETNTLYKTFEIDDSKYTALTNFSVKEITRGKNRIFNETKTWAYHLDKNYYFGGINSDSKYEIAWGVGLDNSSATRTYLISYTVEDVIKKYGDCSELYWQFVGKDFEVSAEKITGTISLPEKVKNIEELRVWGHTKKLNGEIYATDKDTIEFSVNRYQAGNFVEVRIAMPNYVMEDLSYTSKQNKLDDIIEEETKWAEEANRQRIILKAIIITFIIIGAVVGLVILFVLLKKMQKYIKILKGMKKYEPMQKLEYFRELPDKKTTPGEALLLTLKESSYFSTNIGNIFSATLLDLNLKGYIEIIVQKNDKNKDDIRIKLKEQADDKLGQNEKVIFDFLNKIIKYKEITMRELQEQISKKVTRVSIMTEQVRKLVIKEQQEKQNYDEKENEKKNKFSTLAILYLILGISLIVILPIAIFMIINSIICFKIARKCNVLTQKGVNESEKWKGLKKYMLEFSLLNEKEVPAIEIWEEYLVYATAFGIADKVIKQLKLVYPQIEEMSSFNTTSYVYLMSHTNFNSSFSSAINSSMSTAMSSGSGRRRRIFRWRRRSEAGGGGRRRPMKLKNKKQSF